MQQRVDTSKLTDSSIIRFAGLIVIVGLDSGVNVYLMTSTA